MSNVVPAEIAASSPDVSQIMMEILTAAGKAVPSDATYIILFDGDYAQVAYARGILAEALTALQRPPISIAGVPIFSHALADKAPYSVMDTKNSPDWILYPSNCWIHSSLGVPIELEGKIIGMLTANSATHHCFQPADLEKLHHFARYAGLAFGHARYAAVLEAQVAKRTQELQAAKEQAEAIFNHSRDAIVLVGDDLRIIKNNARFGLLFLGTVVDCQGRSLLEFLHPDDGATLQSQVACTRCQENDSDLEIRAYRQDESLFDAELGISPLPGVGLVCTLRDVTEQKAQVRQLRFFASLQENVTDAVISTDLNSRIQSWNKAAEIIYGWSAAEAIGKTSTEIFNDFYCESANRSQIQHALMTQSYWQGEVIQRCKDGTSRHIFAALTLLRDAKLVPFGMIAICRDISDHKAATAALAESRHFMTQIAEVAPDTIYLFDIASQCNIYSNRNIGILLGYSSEEISGMGNELITVLLHPEDRPRFSEYTTRLSATQGDQVCVFTYRMRHKDGTWRWLESHDKIFRRNAAGEATQLIGVATDITERKQAEQALRRHHDFLQQVIDNVPNLIIVKDSAGRFQLVNGHAAKVYGLTVETMLGKTDADVNDNVAEVAFFRQKDQEALASGQTIFIPEQPILGTYYQTSKIPLLTGAGNGDQLLVVSVDVSKRKEAETALQQALAAEQELNDLKAGFITTTSHEFRTPLAIILSVAETLRIYRDKLTDTQIEERLTKISHQVEHLKTLMADVIELSRLQARRARFSPVPIAPEELCNEIVTEFQEYIAVAHPLVYMGNARLPVLDLDERLMRQIITNLLSNAIKYSAVDKPVSLQLAYQDETLSIIVKDEGIGIPAGDMKHLFQPFYRASNVGTIPGTGLGLVIAKESVELHGGMISLESQLGKGTTFIVRIPLLT